MKGSTMSLTQEDKEWIGQMMQIQVNKAAVVQGDAKEATTEAYDRIYANKGAEAIDQAELQLMMNLVNEKPVCVTGKRGTTEVFYPSEQKLYTFMEIRNNRKKYREGVRTIK